MFLWMSRVFLEFFLGGVASLPSSGRLQRLPAREDRREHGFVFGEGQEAGQGQDGEVPRLFLFSSSFSLVRVSGVGVVPSNRLKVFFVIFLRWGSGVGSASGSGS